MLKEESTLWVLKRPRMKESEDVFMMTMVILVKMVIQSSSATEVPRLNSFLSPKLAFKMRKITSCILVRLSCPKGDIYWLDIRRRRCCSHDHRIISGVSLKRIR